MKYLLLTTLITLASCTEEISNEVKNSSSSDNKTVTETQKFKNKSIRLVHKMDEQLSYVMHKYGDASKPCEVNAPALGFKVGDYSKKNKNYAVDCILDVEELDLQFNGAKVELQVDEFLCEYVEYKPYSFVNHLIGSSRNATFKVECDEICEKGTSSYASLCGQHFNSLTLDNGTGTPVSVTTSSTTLLSMASMPANIEFRQPFVGDRGNVCLYEYENANCDLGYYKTYTFNLSSVDHDDDTETENICVTTSHALEVTGGEAESCGGDATQCLGGPGVERYTTKDSSTNTSDVKYKFVESTTTIYNNEDLEKFEQEFTYDAPFNKEGNHNLYLANYSRICANVEQTKTTALGYEDYARVGLKGFNLEEINSSKVNEVTGARQHPFLSSLTDITTDSTWGWESNLRDDDADIYGSVGFGEIIGYDHAHHPLHAKFGVQPYYSFKCLDKARDTKAQIRLFIREWDKFYEKSNQYLSYSSDADSTGTKYMDLSNEAQDGTEFWNDYDDLDDFFTNVGSEVFQDNGEKCTLSDNSDENGDGFFDANNERHKTSSFPRFRGVK
ncbi:MAG: hypothetical protein VYA54_01515 [Bdellovibrionota bacterium]|nr:hypothetical protein [Bdellovibrionota bacterium]